MMVQTYVQRSCWGVVTERSSGREGESCLMHPASCQQNDSRQANRRINTSGFGRRGFFMQLAEGDTHPVLQMIDGKTAKL